MHTQQMCFQKIPLTVRGIGMVAQALAGRARIAGLVTIGGVTAIDGLRKPTQQHAAAYLQGETARELQEKRDRPSNSSH
jgi:hypothetical protein